jgi:hypothetical protein
MVPAILGRSLGLYPRVLNRYTVPDPLLLHGNSEQLAHLTALCFAFAKLQSLLGGQAVCVDQAERFASVGHGVVLPFEIEHLLFADFGLVELPGAVDSPVTEGTVAGGMC